MLKKNKAILTVVGVYSFLAIILYFFTPNDGLPFDTFCWINWSKYIFENGLQNIYSSNTDYLPLYHYVLFLYGKLQGNLHDIEFHIHRLKIVTLFFEAGSAYILFRLLEQKFKDTYKALLNSLFYFCNLAVLYNSLVWGQVDGILSFFVFASIIAAYYKRFFPAVLCFMLAVNMKLQAIIFLPLFLALIIPAIKKDGLRNSILSLITVLILQVLIVLPFLLSGHYENLLTAVTGSVGRYPVISMNAYNFWHLVLDGDLMSMKDNSIFAGLTYMRWGQLFFLLSGFASLYYLIKPNYLFLFANKPFEVSRRKILITATLIPLLFFFFNTQMHERYTHPAFIFLAAYSLLYGKPFLLITGSLAYFLNLEDVYMYMDSGNYHTFIFSKEFIASLYALCIVLLFMELYDINLLGFFRKKDKISFEQTVEEMTSDTL